MLVQTAEPYITHTWQWRGHNINYAVAGCGPPVVFVHGFGASIGHFRRNIPALAQSYKACSARPVQLQYPASILPACMRACTVHMQGQAAGMRLQVYALDLLGFGRSDKPLLEYSTELWRDQLLDFLTEYVDAPAVLVGNSIGSLVSLMVRHAVPPTRQEACLMHACQSSLMHACQLRAN